MEQENKGEKRFKLWWNKKIIASIKAKHILGALVGIAAGFFYYHFFGCHNGCPLKSSPWAMMGFGLLVGITLTTDF
jgi:hypothetical protein